MPANDGTLARVLLQQGFSAAAATAIDNAVWDAGIGGGVGDVVGGGVGLVVVSPSMSGEDVRAAIQAALDTGVGEVRVVCPDGGIVTLGDSLIVRSHTTLVIDKSTHLQWPAGKAESATSQRAMIENEAKTAERQSCTVTAVGRVATVALADHGKSVGDAVMIMGAATRGYNGGYRIESVPNSSTFTVLLDSKPAATPAVANTYFDSVKVCTADQQIRVVIDGTLDGNGSTIPVTTDTPTMGVILSCVLNSWVQGSGRMVDMQGYTATVAGGSYCGFDFDNLSIWNPRRDGCHMQGPIRHGVIRGCSGYTHDDFTSLTTGDYAQYNEMTEGEFEDVTIEDINCDVPDTGAACAMFGKSRWWFSDIRYSNIRGRCANALVSLKRLPLASQYSLDKPVFVGPLLIEDARVYNSTSQTNYVSLLQATGDPTLRSVVLRDVSVDGFDSTNQAQLMVFNRTAADWSFETILIDGFTSSGQGNSPFTAFAAGITGHKITIANSAPAVRENGAGFSFAGVTLKELLVDNCNPTFSGAGTGVLVSLSGASVIDYVTVKNCTPKNATTGAGSLVYWNTCVIRALTVEGCGWDGAQLVWGDVNMDVTGNPSVRLRGNVTRGTTKLALLNKAVRIVASGNRELNPGAVYDLRGASQVYSVTEQGIDSESATPFSFTGGATVNLYSPDRRVNVATVGINRVDGGALWNTNAAAGTLGTGPAVCVGTAANSWKRVGNYTLAY